MADNTRQFRWIVTIQGGLDALFRADPQAFVAGADSGELSGWQRQRGTLEEIEPMAGWRSPRLGIRFEIESGALQLYQPDGERFVTYVELIEQREQEYQRAERLAARLRALSIAPEEA
jgi:hypothetical protein